MRQWQQRMPKRKQRVLSIALWVRWFKSLGKLKCCSLDEIIDERMLKIQTREQRQTPTYITKEISLSVMLSTIVATPPPVAAAMRSNTAIVSMLV